MKIIPLREDLNDTLKKHNLQKKFSKQKQLFEQNTNHPSLHTEKLEPTRLLIYSFRIDRKYRAIFVVTKEKKVEIIDINLHYQ